MTIRAKISAVSTAAAVALLLASSANATTVNGHRATAAPKAGTNIHANFLALDHHVTIAIATQEVPDYLRQQVFRVQR